MGFPRYESGRKKTGWLCNMHSTTIESQDIPGGKAGVDYYFIGEDGDTFKATLEYDPYFLLAVKRGKEAEVEEYCRRAFEGLVKGIRRVEKEDLSMPNHLLGYRRTFLVLSFANVNDLLAVRKAVGPVVERNKKKVDAMDTYAEVARSVVSLAGEDGRSAVMLTLNSANADFDIFDDDAEYEKRPTATIDASEFILDIREYDVPYHVRVAIDKGMQANPSGQPGLTTV